MQRSARARFTIVFGVRTQQDAFAAERLQSLLKDAGDRVRLITILSHEPAGSGWEGLRGLITEALDDKLGVDYREVAAFICGSLPMVEAVEKKLLHFGTAAERIHADKFIPTGY